MESPINPAVWKVVFNAAVGTLSVLTLYSVWHQKRDMLTTMTPAFRKLNRCTRDEEKEEVLLEVLSQLQADAVKRQSASRMSAMQNGAQLVKALKLNKDGSNASLVRCAVKVLLRVFGVGEEGQQRLQALGGYKALLMTLSEAHRQGNAELLEEVAEALNTLTRVSDDEIVLATDVPSGAEGTCALATMPVTVKMLRLLDPSSSVQLLSALTGVFANLCALQVGAVNVGKGTDNVSGVCYFLRLLEHGNRAVVEHALLTVRYLARAGVGRDEIATAESAKRLARHLRVSNEPQVINTLLTIILIMTGDEKNGSTFLVNLADTNAFASLFEVWVRSPEKMLRGRAEALCRMLMRVGPVANNVTTLFLRFRGQIEERQKKDEQEEQREAQQMMQREFMQRMMMEQMGMA